MKLNVSERMGLLQVLPQQHNFATMKVLLKLRDAIGLDEAEVTEAKVRQEGDQLKWDSTADFDKDVEIGETSRGIIVEALQQADVQKALTPLTVGLYERFVTNPEDPQVSDG